MFREDYITRNITYFFEELSKNLSNGKEINIDMLFQDNIGLKYDDVFDKSVDEIYNLFDGNRMNKIKLTADLFYLNFLKNNEKEIISLKKAENLYNFVLQNSEVYDITLSNNIKIIQNKISNWKEK